MKSRGWRIAWAVAIGIVLSSIAIDISRPMWADEIYTVLTARQPSVSDILVNIREGCEGSPPLYLAIVHFLIPLFRNDALAARLPATLGFGAMLLGVFTFCKARMNAAYSLLAALLCCQVCLYFAREGRPYGAVLGCATWALVFWQRIPAGRRGDWMGLAACLGLAVSLHYYAICILGPLLLAEMTMAWRERKWNPGILWAMTVPIMILTVHYPLINAARPFHIHVWSKAEFAMILPFYQRFLGPILLLCGGAFAVFAVFTRLAGRARESVRNLPLRDMVMLLALCATPALTVMVSMVTTHMFVDRYVLWAAPGFAIVAAATLERSVAPNMVVPKSLIAILLTILCIRQAVGIATKPKLAEGAEALNRLKGLGRIEGVIVIPDAHLFVELAYYAPSYIRNRLIYPEDADLDIRYFGNDSSPLQYRAFGKRGELAVQGLDQLLARYHNFTMVAYSKDYLPNYLRRRGWQLKLLTESDQPVIWYAKRDRTAWRALSTSR